MDYKDCFQTVSYRGGWIHFCQNRTYKRPEVRVQFANGEVREVKSYRAAQLALNAASKTPATA